MNKKTCCTKDGLNRGAWTVPEDNLLVSYINAHGEGKWSRVPMEAGLKRSGKSCRLRWLNYLSPNIKRGNFSEEEEDLIIRLQKLLGNRWSLIAGRLPGRTDNGIKNFWNTTLVKKVRSQQPSTKKPCTHARRPLCKTKVTTAPPSASPPAPQDETVLIRTKAIKCNRAYFPGSRVISSSPSAEPEETPVVPQIMQQEDTIVSRENCSFDLHLDSLYDAMDLQGWFQFDAEVDEWCLG